MPPPTPPLAWAALASAWAVAVALPLVGPACGDAGAPAEPLAAEPGEELSGGETTVFDETGSAFARPAKNLDQDGRNVFGLGDHLFNRGWVTAPASAEGSDGLGPTFVANNCSACHLHDGRGKPPDGPDDEDGEGLLLRLSVPGEGPQGEPVGEPTYGGQLGTRAIPGVPAEGTLRVSYEERAGAYEDGEAYSLRVPTYEVGALAHGPFATGTLTSPRVGQHLVGLGLLAAIDEATLRSLADPSDADGDGVSGRLNEVWDVRSQTVRAGRFGWKANQPTLEQQVAGAFHGDLGITSDLFPEEDCPAPQTACLAAPTGGTPELDASKLASITFYQHTIAVPARRDVDDPAVLRGRELFRAMGCASCHTPRLQTGTLDGFPELSDQTIRPFTDLLLHDMGPDLADGRPDFGADGQEWRTPPLWGLGLFEAVSGHLLLLHDGRARGVAEAILWHGGEAEPAREAFRAAPRDDRDDLLRFLESL